MTSLIKNLTFHLLVAVVSLTGVSGVHAFQADEMVTIPAGEFPRGCNEGDPGWCPKESQPKKNVYLRSYKIDKYMVTYARYQKCLDAGQCTELFAGAACNAGMSWNARHPVNCVDWFQAKAFCEFEGRRLPTEAEWEKAARGTDSRTYPWGEAKPNCNRAVMNKKPSPDKMGPGCGRGTTREVGRKTAGVSPYGVHDMAGNLFEWVSDWYSPNYFKNAPKNNPKGPGNGQARVGRGSAWTSRADQGLSLNVRYGYAPVGQGYVVGFRCAKDN